MNKARDSSQNQQSALAGAINNFLSNCFGLPSETFSQPGIFASSSGKYIERDPDDIKTFERNETIVVLASVEKLRDLESGLSSAPQLFQLLAKYKKTYDDTDRFISADSLIAHEISKPFTVRPLMPDDQKTLEKFYGLCSKEESENVDIDLENAKAWGAFDKDELVAASRYYLIPNTQIADLGVIVRPDFRAKGLAKGLITVAVKQAFIEGLFPRYRTNKDNLSTIAVASALGFEANYSIKNYETN
jgi:RimJ/RimL family protein N-acetyltransferase